MTKEELSKYAGKKIYALCRRPGGIGQDIDCLTLYRITNRGTLLYVTEIMGCVANKKQFSEMQELTKGSYVIGRPTADKINKEEIMRLINIHR